MSMQPLHILVFQLPLILIYDAGSTLYLSGGTDGGGGEVLLARYVLLRFFATFGVVGHYLPGLAQIAVLMVGHVVERRRWRVQPGVLGGMVMESMIWTVPLLVLGVLLQSGPAIATEPEAAGVLLKMPWQARLTIAIGAGLYEELLFRMVAIAMLHLLLVDLMRIPDRWGKVLAVTGSAMIFAVFHDSAVMNGTGFDAAQFLLFFLPGLYFGTVFVLRGLGIVVGVHILYDIVVLLAPSG